MNTYAIAAVAVGFVVLALIVAGFAREHARIVRMWDEEQEQ